MHLCELDNQTFAVLGRNLDSFITVKEGIMLVGFLGKLYDNLLIRKSKRKCLLIESNELGKRISENGTYSGILELLRSNVASLYFKTETPYYEEDFIDINCPIGTEKFSVQELMPNDDNSKALNNNIMNSLYIDEQFSTLVIVFFTVVMIVVDFSKTTSFHRQIDLISRSRIYLKNLKNGTPNFPLINLVYSLSAIGVFLLFYDLHLFFTRLIIVNNIKTTKVLIDTSSILRDDYHILQTKKIACYFESESELKISMGAAKTSILRRIYEEKSNLEDSDAENPKKCIYDSNDLNFSFENKFSVISHTFAYVLHILFQGASTNRVIWLNESPVYESNSYFYIRKGSEYTDYYRKVQLFYLESGILIRFKDLLKNSAHVAIFHDRNRIYYNIASYVDDHSQFDSLTLDNYRTLFYLYLGFCLMLLIIQIMVRSLNRLIKSCFKVNQRKIKRMIVIRR